MLSNEERVFALLSHVLTFCFLGLLAPLIIWLLKKDQSAYVERHAKESLNFQISILIYGVVCFILSFILIGIFLAFVLGIFSVIVIIVATFKAYNGDYYRYPLTIRLIP